VCAWAQPDRFTSADFLKFRSVADVHLSPEGAYVAYTVSHNDGPGRPYSRLFVRQISSGNTVAFSEGKEGSGFLEWSRDGQWLAYSGKLADKSGLLVARPDGSNRKFIAPMEWTNGPLPSTGARVTWSPDGKQVVFSSAKPGPEDPSSDPVVITRYLYKPDDAEGNSRFNDNKRTHLFLADIASGQVRQLTDGAFYEHSVDWSPDGREVLYITNHDADSDQFFNYDIFSYQIADGSSRRLTATENIEYRPRWSPDGKRIIYQGTRRGLTDLETTMEDTHVWLISADGSTRKEIGAGIDNRQGPPQWAPDGKSVYFTVQERGSVNLYRLPVDGGSPEPLVRERGIVGSFSVGKGGALAYSLSTPKDLGELYLNGKQITDLNADVLRGKTIGEVEPFTFVSNDNRFEVEAFLTKPAGLTATSHHPLIVMIHGGPHGQQGPAFNFKSQVYASRGWGTLMVNYRGSTGYGQKFADAVFGDQNGNEGQDVIYAVSAAIRRNPWIDRDRMGVEGTSYGGQLSAWLVTQTSMFKAAIPQAAIINLVSYNYMTYYNQYEQMTFGVFPHQGTLMDTLWERSSLRYAGKVRTPTMLIHGENDNDVPIAEAEQFYIALKDVGVDTVFLRYPREGHGLREPKHQVDSIERSIRWYEKYFPK
jgi:dipeptidyl aminopeptidase/acylaminoacyl peptidase